MANPIVPTPEINPRTGQEYYARHFQDIVNIARVLNIGGGRLQKLTPDLVRYYMDMVEQSIDGYLEEYYFTPIRLYNLVMPDGTLKKVFPGKLRRLAQYWTAGLLLTSEFQQLDSNTNELLNSYMDDSRAELFQFTSFEQRIPGALWRSGISRTMPPTMQPPKPPEQPR